MKRRRPEEMLRRPTIVAGGDDRPRWADVVLGLPRERGDLAGWYSRRRGGRAAAA